MSTPKAALAPARRGDENVKPLPASKTSAKAAAERCRCAARAYRSQPGSQDAIRARVRMEMRREAQECRERTIARLTQEEEAALIAQQARRAERVEARRVYMQALQAEEEGTATSAESAPHLPIESASAHVEALLRERAERRQQDAASAAALRERVAARRPDPQKFGQDSQQAKVQLESRSLFTWRPPPSIAAPKNQPGDAYQSDAARDAWAWVKG